MLTPPKTSLWSQSKNAFACRYKTSGSVEREYGTRKTPNQATKHVVMLVRVDILLYSSVSVDWVGIKCYSRHWLSRALEYSL